MTDKRFHPPNKGLPIQNRQKNAGNHPGKCFFGGKNFILKVFMHTVTIRDRATKFLRRQFPDQCCKWCFNTSTFSFRFFFFFFSRFSYSLSHWRILTCVETYGLSYSLQVKSFSDSNPPPPSPMISRMKRSHTLYCLHIYSAIHIVEIAPVTATQLQRYAKQLL